MEGFKTPEFNADKITKGIQGTALDWYNNLNKATVENAYDRMKEMQKNDGKITLAELSELNSMRISELRTWVKNQRTEWYNDAEKAERTSVPEKKAFDQMVALLDGFEREIANLAKTYETQKREIQGAAEGERLKLEESLGITRPKTEKTVTETVTTPVKTEAAPAKTEEKKEAAPAKTENSEKKEPHTVKKGETLSKIAKEHGVSMEALRAANGHLGDPNKLKVGEKLAIPEAVAKNPEDKDVAKHQGAAKASKKS